MYNFNFAMNSLFWCVTFFLLSSFPLSLAHLNREHIERENRKWQKLFQTANLRKRQAIAQLEEFKGTNPSTSTPTTTTVMDTG